MSEIRIPGVAWAIILIALIAGIHENEAALQARYGVEPFYLDLLVAALIGVLKTLSLGTGQLNVALDIIEKLLARRRVTAEPKDGMRSSGRVEEEILVQEIPRRPNKLITWLFG